MQHTFNPETPVSRRTFIHYAQAVETLSVLTKYILQDDGGKSS